MNGDISIDIPNIGINYFLTFKQVLKYGSFSKTAKKLMISEGAVRHRIDTIEQYLGLKLLNRRVNGVSATEAGNLLLINLQKLEEFNKSLDLIRDKYAMDNENNLKICAGEIAIIEILPKALRDFKKKFRGTEIFVESSHARNCIIKLFNGDIDVAIVGGLVFPELSLEWDKLLAIDIYETPLCVAVPVSSHLAFRHTITSNDLKHEQIIRRKAGSATQAIVDKLIGGSISPINNHIFHLEMETASGLLQAVSRGLGIGIVSEIQASRFANKSKVKILRLDPEVKIKLKAVISRENNKAIIQEFFNYLKKKLETKDHVDFIH